MLDGMLLFVALAGLLFLRFPVFIALIIVGSCAHIFALGIDAWWHWVSFSPWSMVSHYHYSAIPLFLLMGQIATDGNITKDLFSAADKALKGQRGSLSIATIISCTIFGSLCGSSLATASTMTPVSYKEMKLRNYSNEIIFGTLAAGGTLGVLVPPSIVLVIYAIIAEESVASLSIAAIIPAIMAFVGYIAAIKYFAYKYPADVPKNSPHLDKHKPVEDKHKLWISLTCIFLLFVVMLSGLYTGKFMPTEAAAVGVIGVLAIVAFMGNFRSLNWSVIFSETAKTTAIIMAIFVGAEIVNTALAALDFPEEFSEYVLSRGEYPMLVIFIMIFALIILGCFMDGIAITLLVVPLLLPIVSEMNLGIEHVGIWFGIIILIIVEIGLITPPLGLNLFVIKSIEPGLQNVRVIKAIKYFLVSDIVRISLLVLIPTIKIFPSG